jgi:hypothetical protein
MSESVAVVILIGIGLIVGLALLAFLTRSTRAITRQTGLSPALGMSAGMLLGAILGVIVWVSTGDFVFWVVFVGGGMVTGLAIGTSLAERRR